MKPREHHGGCGTELYHIWKSMIQRCHNPKSRDFCKYGARGISVCDHWKNSFVAFRSDMGERPAGMSIDRVDVHGGYSPDNCRWATPSLQTRNSRVRRDTSTGIKGVSLLLRKKVWKYQVHISVNGVRTHLGYTPDLFEAACWRKSAELRLGYHH